MTAPAVYRRRTKSRAAPTHREEAEQIALFQWIALSGVADLRKLYHVPNGGTRNPREAGRLKAAGVKAGVSDLFLPVARRGYFGLYIELKAPKPGGGPPTAAQAAFLEAVRADGYRGEVCYGWHEARGALVWYARGEPTVPGQAGGGQ